MLIKVVVNPLSGKHNLGVILSRKERASILKLI